MAKRKDRGQNTNVKTGSGGSKKMMFSPHRQTTR